MFWYDSALCMNKLWRDVGRPSGLITCQLGTYFKSKDTIAPGKCRTLWATPEALPFLSFKHLQTLPHRYKIACSYSSLKISVISWIFSIFSPRQRSICCFSLILTASRKGTRLIDIPQNLSCPVRRRGARDVYQSLG